MTFTIGPDDPDFERLPRQIQARIYKAHGWTIQALSDEFEVSETTIKRWTNPDYARRLTEALRKWEATPEGRQKRNSIRRKHYAQNRDTINARRREKAASTRMERRA